MAAPHSAKSASSRRRGNSHTSRELSLWRDSAELDSTAVQELEAQISRPVLDRLVDRNKFLVSRINSIVKRKPTPIAELPEENSDAGEEEDAGGKGKKRAESQAAPQSAQEMLRLLDELGQSQDSEREQRERQAWAEMR